MSNRSDTFDRSDSASALGTPSDAGSAWVANAGTWGITSNLGYKVSANNNFQAASLECSSSVGTVEVTVTNVSNQGVVGRLVDASNFILGQIASSNFLAVYKRVGGTFTQIGSTYSGTTSDFDVVSMAIDASNNITLYQNGVSRVTGNDSAHSTATKWGMMIYSTSSLMDDWSFTDAGGGGPTEYVITPSGGVVMSGAAPISRDRVLAPAGGIVMGGTASDYATHEAQRLITPSGGVVMGGTAPISTGATTEHVLAVSGGITMGGAAPITRDRTVVPSGGIVMGGSATDYETHSAVREITPSGGITMGGSARITFTSALAPAGRARMASMGTRTMRSDSRMGMRFNQLPEAA